MISKKCKYAIKAILYITKNQDRTEPIFSWEIAEKENIPKKFLETILRELCNSRILISKRGKTGGYKLLKKANEISLTDVIRIMDGPIALLPCVSIHYYASCDECDEESCTIKTIFEKVRDSTLDILSEAKIDTMI